MLVGGGDPPEVLLTMSQHPHQNSTPYLEQDQSLPPQSQIQASLLPTAHQPY